MARLTEDDMSDIDHVQAAAYDACCKVSPSNPRAVAEAIEEAFEVLRDLTRNDDNLTVAEAALTSITERGKRKYHLKRHMNRARALLARMEKRR